VIQQMALPLQAEHSHLHPSLPHLLAFHAPLVYPHDNDDPRGGRTVVRPSLAGVDSTPLTPASAARAVTRPYGPRSESDCALARSCDDDAFDCYDLRRDFYRSIPRLGGRQYSTGLHSHQEGTPERADPRFPDSADDSEWYNGTLIFSSFAPDVTPWAAVRARLGAVHDPPARTADTPRVSCE
jgi:hypothetical protein